MNDIKRNVGRGRGALLVGGSLGRRGGWVNKHARGVVVVGWMDGCVRACVRACLT